MTVVTADRIRHGAAREYPGDQDRAARAHEAQPVLDVLDDAFGVGVDQDDVVGGLVHPRQHVGGPPVMNRARAAGIRASANAARAAPRCSGSLSMVVSVAPW